MRKQPVTQISKPSKLQPAPSLAAKFWNIISLLLTLAGVCLMGFGGFIYFGQVIESNQPPPARIVQVTVDPNPISTATAIPTPTSVQLDAEAVAPTTSEQTSANQQDEAEALAAQADILVLPSPTPMATAVPAETTVPPAEAMPAATNTPIAAAPDEALSLADNPLAVVEEEASAAEALPAPATPPTTAGTRLTRIVADSIGLNTEVIEVGWTQVVENGIASNVWVVADYAAGWHKNSALPGQGDNVVLSAHHNIKGEVFRYIVDIEPGATVTLQDNEGRSFDYFVEDKFIVKDKGEPEAVRRENAKWIGSFNEERLTLVTCWPYNNNTHRVIVIAKPLGDSQASN